MNSANDHLVDQQPKSGLKPSSHTATTSNNNNNKLKSIATTTSSTKATTTTAAAAAAAQEIRDLEKLVKTLTVGQEAEIEDDENLKYTGFIPTVDELVSGLNLDLDTRLDNSDRMGDGDDLMDVFKQHSYSSTRIRYHRLSEFFLMRYKYYALYNMV